MRGDSAQLVKEVRRANSSVTKFGASAKKAFGGIAAGLAGLGAVRGIKNLVTGFAEAGDEAAKLARALGTTTESLTAYQFAAERSGISSKELETGLRTITKRANDAARGLATASDAFEAIGVTVTDSSGNLKDIDTLLVDVANGFGAIEDETKRAALAQELFGRSGLGFVNLLGEGASGLQELTNQARQFGSVITNEAGAAAERFQDALTNVNAQAKGLRNSFGTGFIQVFTPFLESLTSSKETLSAFKTAGEGAATALKALALSGSLVKNTFDVVGKAIGGVAAALVSIAKGEFRQALENVREAWGDIKTDVDDVSAAFDAAFASTIPDTKELNANLDKTKETLGGVNKALDKINENKALKKQAEIAKEVETAAAESIAQFNKEYEALQANIEARSEEIKGSLQDTFGDELTRIAEGNFSQIGDSFANLIQRMLIDAASSELTSIFGNLLGGFGQGGLGGGGARGFIGSLFGGFRANGGPVGAGRGFMVGERGPELFVPSVAGNVVPNGGGMVNVTNNFSVSAPNGRLSPESQQQLAAKAGSAVQRAVNRNR